MDPNYAMAKFGLESKNILKSKHRGCWYYTKYFFFFLSIIQFLIILGLVLFMLYGNAHYGTEQRLSSVENRFKNLSIDYTSLYDNHSQLRNKFTILEKQHANCSALLYTAIRQLKNITVPGRQVITLPPPPEVCRGYQFALDKLNTSCIIETLQIKHQILLLQRDNERLRENYDQTNTTLTKKVNDLTSDKETLQNSKEDLEKQSKLFQNVCTNINQKFDLEIEVMKNRFEGIIKNDPFHYSKCWAISDDIKSNIEQTISRMKQEVNIVMYENSHLKTENARATQNFQKCSQEKTATISEKNQLSKEKGVLEKQLSEKKEEHAKCLSQYVKKLEELEACRKIPTIGRVSVGQFPRI